MRICITFMFFTVLAAHHALGYELEQRLSRSLAVKIKTASPLSVESKKVLLCPSDPNFRIKRLFLGHVNAEFEPNEAVSLALTSSGCFQIGNLQFHRSGIWQLAIWDQKDTLYRLPLVVADHKHRIFDRTGKSSLQVWVANSELSPGAEAWLFCHQNRVERIFLYHPSTKTQISHSNLRDFGSDCQVFTDLPLSQKGIWQMMTVLQNGQKLFGKIVYH